MDTSTSTSRPFARRNSQLGTTKLDTTTIAGRACLRKSDPGRKAGATTGRFSSDWREPARILLFDLEPAGQVFHPGRVKRRQMALDRRAHPLWYRLIQGFFMSSLILCVVTLAAIAWRLSFG